MTCDEIQDLIPPFADGELDGAEAGEVALHIERCDGCACEVTAIRSLRVRTRSAFVAEAAVAGDGLRERVLSAVHATALAESVRGGGRASVAKKPAAGAPRGTLSLRWWTGPLAVAASAAFAFVLWERAPAPRVEPRVPVLAATPAAALVQGHRHSGSLVQRHTNQSLPRDHRAMESRLSDRLGFPVIAPDLESFGYKLAGVESTSLGDMPAAHIFYRTDDDRTLSVFSLPDWPRMDTAQAMSKASLSYFVSTHDVTCVAAWRGSSASYAVCGDIDCDRAVLLASSIRKKMVCPDAGVAGAAAGRSVSDTSGAECAGSGVAEVAPFLFEFDGVR